jgi:hypothetical protein
MGRVDFRSDYLFQGLCAALFLQPNNYTIRFFDFVNFLTGLFIARMMPKVVFSTANNQKSNKSIVYLGLRIAFQVSQNLLLWFRCFGFCQVDEWGDPGRAASRRG